MTNTSKLFSLLAVLLFSGCMTTGEVAKLDRDTYVVSTATGNGAYDNQEMLMASAKKATDFCAKQNKDMLRSDALLSHTGYGNREFMFSFKCVARN